MAVWVFTTLCWLLAASSITGQSIEAIPRQAVRTVGGEATFICKVAYPIKSCRIFVGKESYIMTPDDPQANPDLVYAGQGLEKGECGVHLRRIREEWHGNITCWVPPAGGNKEVPSVMQLIVARAPKGPFLQFEKDAKFKEGDDFTARCLVSIGRPEAKISWLLDGEPLVTGLHEPVLEREGNTDMTSISQNLTKMLTADDSGRKLSCVADHEAWAQAKSVHTQLSVHYAPKPQDGDSITVFGLKLSEEGRINVTVRANPPPTVEWTVRDETLRSGDTDREGGLRALEPLNLGNGYYNCTLVVQRLSKEDVEKQYYLNVSNSQGYTKLSVRISTMDEPAGAELGAGAIVGIVVAVLALLVAVSLVVFAKATDRWCFAGDRRDAGKSSGESTRAAGDVLLEERSPPPPPALHPSDTESASGRAGRWRLSELRERVRNALPRHKDKVQAADQHADQPADDDKAAGDEKKGVVYAELALGEVPPAKPAPPATDYAEIVYTATPAVPATPATPAADNK